MIQITMPHVGVVHFPGLPLESFVTLHEVTEEAAAAEEEHIVLRLYYAAREEPSFDQLDAETAEAEEEERWRTENSQVVHYRLTWREREGVLFNLHEFVPSSPIASFPIWYETFCTRLIDYVNGYLFDHPWRLDAYETIVPVKLGGLVESVPILETPAEIGARTRVKELQRQRGERALQTDFFEDCVTPVFYVTP